MEIIYLKKMREQVDESFVGFRPNGSSVKPVHIYSGASRIIYGESVNTQNIKRLSYVSDAKGKTCLLYTYPSPRHRTRSRMPSSD